jgi:hypothetical protein
MDTSIYNAIFDGQPVTEEYIEPCEILLKALKANGTEDEAQYYEDAGFAFCLTPKAIWGQHLLEVAYRIDERNKRLRKDY